MRHIYFNQFLSLTISHLFGEMSFFFYNFMESDHILRNLQTFSLIELQKELSPTKLKQQQQQHYYKQLVYGVFRKLDKAYITKIELFLNFETGENKNKFKKISSQELRRYTTRRSSQSINKSNNRKNSRQL
ncbi:unnamed protein product [Paramecium sonneborni]|uniref:Uncharacterized protein n=1 Tax=Paramecium sonneborni TaxID=65129 RepID=A0A8S1RQQ4_9CILI|nr:unnamed protein product [Paramecium sonneborni]